MNECVKNGCIVIEYIRSKDNIADMFTKSVGPIIFQAHYPFVMGWLEIPRVSLVVETLEEEYLPCPNCSTGYCKREDNPSNPPVRVIITALFIIERLFIFYIYESVYICIMYSIY